MYRTGLAVLLALALVGCEDIIFDPQPPDVVIETVCPCVGGSPTHDVYITEEIHETVYVTEEDTTPDVVQEFYGDAASLPVLLLEGTGSPMPKKLSNPLIASATSPADDDLFLLEQGGSSKSLAAVDMLLPTNAIGGLITSNDSGDTDHDIAIAPGIARSADDTANLRLASILTKQIDAVWAVGDDAGGLDAAPVVAADTLYAVWLIKNPTSGIVDALFSLDFAAPTMPAGYTLKRLIGAVKTKDSSANIVPYLQSGDQFTYIGDSGQKSVEDVSDASITSGVYEDGTLSVPPLCLANIVGAVQNVTTTTSGILLFIKTKGAFLDSADLRDAFANFTMDTPNEAIQISARGVVLVDASSQVQYTALESTGSVSVFIRTLGFTMLTRREPQ